jgi:hypothetical protein
MEVQMARAILSILAFSLLLVETAPAQTAKEVREKFGESVEVYSVAEHIWMTPTFTVDGQLCEMRLYPKRISTTTNYLGEYKLRAWELEGALDKLVPPETRGNRTKSFGLTFLLGQSSEATFAYQNVTLTFLASLHFSAPESLNLSCSKCFTNSVKPVRAQTPPENDIKSNDGLTIPRDAEVAVITLSNRVCPKP